jgi:sulfur carrier protein ThiS
MQVLVQQTGQTVELEHVGTARELLVLLAIDAQTVLVVADGALVTDDVDITGASTIELVSVVSGG